MEMKLSVDKPIYPEPPFKKFDEELLSENTEDNGLKRIIFPLDTSMRSYPRRRT